MKTTKRSIPARSGRSIQSLRDLPLDVQDLEALRRQGSVCQEKRGIATYYKLRFRSADGKQHVRYLGNDSRVAETIRQELEIMQSTRQQSKILRRVDANARKLLREIKSRTSPGLTQLGFQYHGFQIRKQRT